MLNNRYAERSRGRTKYPSQGGRACPPLSEHRLCDAVACPSTAVPSRPVTILEPGHAADSATYSMQPSLPVVALTPKPRSAVSSEEPMAVPTTLPTLTVTEPPTAAPSFVPSLSPTFKPSIRPTIVPTIVPSLVPSLSPSAAPTLQPSDVPTMKPTSLQPSTLPEPESWSTCGFPFFLKLMNQVLFWFGGPTLSHRHCHSRPSRQFQIISARSTELTCWTRVNRPEDPSCGLSAAHISSYPAH